MSWYRLNRLNQTRVLSRHASLNAQKKEPDLSLTLLIEQITAYLL